MGLASGHTYNAISEMLDHEIYFSYASGLWHMVVAYEQGPSLGWTTAKPSVSQGRYSPRRRALVERVIQDNMGALQRLPAASLSCWRRSRQAGRCSSNSNRSGHVVLRRHSTKSQGALAASLIFQPMAASLMKKASWMNRAPLQHCPCHSDCTLWMIEELYFRKIRT